MKTRLFTIFAFLVGTVLSGLLVPGGARPDGLTNASAGDHAYVADWDSGFLIPRFTSAEPSTFEYHIDLSPVAKAHMGCTSIYTVTSQSTLSATHEFFEAGVSTPVFGFTDTIDPAAPTPYDLADISGLSDGFTGTVTIGSNQPITATLEPCPQRTYYVYLPMVLRNEGYPAEPITPDDTYYAAYQWNLPQIRAPYAWAVSTSSSDVIVAVLDTGVDLAHPDLQGNLVAGYDFVHDNADPSDDHGHGTHVAGIVAARTNNGVGVAGVSWAGRIMPVKVMDWRGQGTYAQLAEGITWATDHGAQIINLSLGGETDSATLQNAVNYAYNKGCLIVAAVGNCGDDNDSYPNEYCSQLDPIFYPAAYDHVVGVGASGDQDEQADYSNSGYYVDAVAPGGNPTNSWDPNPNHWILSTYWRGAGYGDYLQVAGTSQAAPHAAGLAALIWSASPSLSNDQVEQIIEETAVDLGIPGRDDAFGHGRIDAYGALVRASYGTAAGSGMAVPPLPPADAIICPTSHIPVMETGPTKGEFEAGVVLMKFRAWTSDEGISSVLGKYSIQVTGQISALGVLRLSVPEGMEIDISGQLSQDPAVEYAEPNYLVRAFTY